MLLSRRFKESFKLALAIVMAYGIALSMGWEKPMWAAFAVAVMSLAGAGQSFHKGAMRMLGTLLAILVSLTLLGLFPQDRWWLMLVLSAFVGLCTYMLTGGSGRSYLWQVASFVSVIICMESIPQTDHGFDIAVLRTLETGLGVLCYTLVSMLVWPVSSAGELGAAARALAATQHRLYRGYRALVRRDPWDLTARLCLGRALLRSGQAAQGRRALRAARRLDRDGRYTDLIEATAKLGAVGAVTPPVAQGAPDAAQRSAS